MGFGGMAGRLQSAITAGMCVVVFVDVGNCWGGEVGGGGPMDSRAWHSQYQRTATLAHVMLDPVCTGGARSCQLHMARGRGEAGSRGGKR